jgi:hypothetical protein
VPGIGVQGTYVGYIVLRICARYRCKIPMNKLRVCVYA